MDKVPSGTITITITRKHIQEGLRNSQHHPMECAIADRLKIRLERICCVYDVIVINTLNYGQQPEFETQAALTPDAAREWLAQWEAGPQWSKPLTFELSIN